MVLREFGILIAVGMVGITSMILMSAHFGSEYKELEKKIEQCIEENCKNNEKALTKFEMLECEQLCEKKYKPNTVIINESSPFNSSPPFPHHHPHH